MPSKAVTLPYLRAAKERGEKLVMVTAYDATFARILDDAGIDMLLVGDSLGMVIQGQGNTLPVTLGHMVYHTQCVSRGARRAQVIGDMPFMSYQLSPEQALESAGRLMQEGGAHAVKLEGGSVVVPQVEKIVGAGIPVMGHIGLTPQSVHALGGFKVQGREHDAALRLVEAARALEDAGCYALVLEGIPAELAGEITRALTIPTIGIGAGPECDGQVLVCYDLLGMNPDFTPKFLKRYESLHGRVTAAAEQFAAEVRGGAFPEKRHSFAGRSLHLVTAEPGDPEADANPEVEGVYGGAPR